MANARFFKAPSSYTLAVIAAKCGATLSDENDASFLCTDVAALDQAGPQHLTFLDNKKYKEQFSATNAGVAIIHPDMLNLAPKGLKLLLSNTPYKAYALAAQMFYPEEWGAAGIATTAIIHPTAKIGKNVSINDFVVIDAHVEIGDGCWIEPYAHISKGVVMGTACRIGAHTSVSHATIGHKVRLYTGVRIGQDGFGFAIDPAGYVKVPQLGCVVIGDGVEIGANTTIDRGTTGDTVIGAGTWIDNLVQIAHNVKIGKGCIIAAQVGIAGSAELGNYVAIGGQVGIAGHLNIGTQVRIAAKSGVTKDIPPREEWMGYPAMPMKRFLRQVVTLNKLVEKFKKEK